VYGREREGTEVAVVEGVKLRAACSAVNALWRAWTRRLTQKQAELQGGWWCLWARERAKQEKEVFKFKINHNFQSEVVSPLREWRFHCVLILSMHICCLLLNE